MPAGNCKNCFPSQKDAMMRGLQWRCEMQPLATVGAPTTTSFPPSNILFLPKHHQSRRFRVFCTSSGSKTVRFFYIFFLQQNSLNCLSINSLRTIWLNQIEQAKNAASIPEYKPGVFDDLFLNLFRNKLVEVILFHFLASSPSFSALSFFLYLIGEEGVDIQYTDVNSRNTVYRCQ